MTGTLSSPKSIARAALKALDECHEEAGLALIRSGRTQYPSDAALWQIEGLLHRQLDDLQLSITALETAASLAPGDALIAHGLARTLMEAGRDARPAYDRALTLAPNDGDLRTGKSAAMLAQGEGERAAADLTLVLTANPFWIPGHVQLAQLEALLGRPERATASLDRALAAHPADRGLWTALFDLAIRREDYFALAELVAPRPARLCRHCLLLRYRRG